MIDTTTPLTVKESERVKTVLEQFRGIRIKGRELNAFSPEEIAKVHKLNAGEIARMAGRKDKKEVPS